LIKNIFYLLLTLVAGTNTTAQQKSRYNFFSYSVNEGLLQSTVLDLAVDMNNFCWLSFSNGIQRFDGNSFKIIPIQNGLPDDKNVSIFRKKNGELLFVHAKGISKYNIGKDSFEYVYATPVDSYNKLKLIGEENGILFFYGSDATILALNATTYKREYLVSMPFLLPISAGQYPVFSEIENGVVNFYYREKLFQYHLEQQRLISQSPPLPQLFKNFIMNKNPQSVFCFQYDGVWQLGIYNYTEGRFSSIFKKPQTNINFRGILYNWGDKKLMSYYNRLFLMKNDWSSDSSELVDFKNNHITETVAVAKFVSDNFKNLYLVTVNDGIRKIIKNSYPIQYYGVPGDKKNYALCVYPNKRQNNVLVGTFGNGLLIFDTLQNLIKHFERLPGETTPFSVNAITQNNNGEYIFLAIGKKGAYKLSHDIKHITKLEVEKGTTNISSEARYFSDLVYDGPDRAILQTEIEFFVINKKSNRIKQYQINTVPTHGSLLHNGKLIVHNNDYISEFDTTTFKEIHSFAFPGTSGVRCYATDGKLLYFGSNKGIFITDEKYNVVKQYNRSTGMPDECIYAMKFDELNNLWVSTNKGIVRISKTGHLFQLTKDDGLQENEFNNNVTFRTNGGEIFFGGINGVNSFYPSAIPDYMADINIFFTGLRINNHDFKSDTSLQYVKKIELPYNENSIAINFIASGPQNANRYIHQYKMDGLDKEWRQQPVGEPVRYILQPGKYVFKMYASASFSKEAIAIKELQIIINPPFWKTWWFLSLLSIAAIAVIVYIINRYNKSRYQKRVAILLMQQKVQEERGRISMELHDSIGAYANAVLYNTDLLQEEQDENEKRQIMKDLRFASKDIITSLRETIWALKNENYSATDCLMRIRNFLHPFARYYSTIDFKIEGNAPASKQLHYGLALNVVRIVQESVNNAIKHSNPSVILIKSYIIDESSWGLDIIDNGSGFNINTANAGNGLMNMRKRADEWNFNVTIKSVPEKGTHISIIVP